VLVAGRTPAKIEPVVGTIASAGGSAAAVLTDTTRELEVVALFDRAMAPGSGREPADVVVFNAGNNQRIDFREVTAQLFGFLAGRLLCGFPGRARGGAAIGASGPGYGDLYGGIGSFARQGRLRAICSRAGLRMISQSMAREFRPLGLHVAHVVIDGGINGHRLRSRRPQIVEERGEDGLIAVEAIAETYWQIHRPGFDLSAWFPRGVPLAMARD